MELIVFLLLINSLFVLSKPLEDDCKEACHPLDDNRINVHLIPHSHDDLGWLHTFDEYYKGTGRFDKVENAGVQYIISSVIPALKENPNRRFIQVETGYLWRWWQDQSQDTRNDVINLVQSGQLEIINGGWSMNDEATAHYQSIIDQFTWGFRKIDEMVGKCGRPRIGWQIDPFGHSREHASLIKQMGFDGLLIVRIDYRDKIQRQTEKNLEFMWNTNLNGSKLFTTMFPDFYFSESGFCFDAMCYDSVTDSNIQSKIDKFVTILDKYSKYYKTNNIIMPMGRDFTYQKAGNNYQSLDRFIEGFKNHTTYNVIYSTPSCYIKAVTKTVEAKSITLSEKKDDFFPYASEPHSFWTGFYTSRPSSKGFERLGNKILQSSKQLISFSRIQNLTIDSCLEEFRGTMGVLQHHDSITGTEKQAVADDYARMLYQSIKMAEEPMGTIIGNLLKKNSEQLVDLELSNCLLSNVSICETSQKDKFLIIVYNPLSRTVTQHIKVAVDGDSYQITGPDGVEAYDIFDSFKFANVDAKRGSRELIFSARNIPGFGIKSYYLEKTSDGSEYKPWVQVSNPDDAHLGNQNTGFSFDSDSGKLSTITINGTTLNISQEFLYYQSYTDGIEGDHRSSGAYIFRPANNTAFPMSKTIINSITKGNIVDCLLQVISDEVTQIIRVYKTQEDSFIEFDWLVGDLQFIDNKGKEVITRFTIDNFLTNGVFFTDANGRQTVERHLNTRSDFSYNSTEEPVASNYYPVTSKISLKNEVLRVSILTDRSQGGSSLSDGSIELMVHRRLKQDDGYGVTEVLNEEEFGKGLYVRGQHYLTFGSDSLYERELAQNVLLKPWVLYSDKFSSLDDVQNNINLEFAGLKKELSKGLHILTFEPWTDGYLLRLENLFEENTQLQVDLSDMFALFHIVEVIKTQLGGNEAVSKPLESFLITINPMEIKTFIIKTDKNNNMEQETCKYRNENDTNNSKPGTRIDTIFFWSFLFLILAKFCT